MEHRGRNRWQENRRAPHRSCANGPFLLPTAATDRRSQPIRRGSTVRVRERALQECRTWALFRSARLARCQKCGGHGAVRGACVFRTSRRSAFRPAIRTRSSYSDQTGARTTGLSSSSVVPGRHHCRRLDHEHNGAAKGMRTVHDAARDRHPLTGTEHERLAPLYLELEPAL